MLLVRRGLLLLLRLLPLLRLRLCHQVLLQLLLLLLMLLFVLLMLLAILFVLLLLCAVSPCRHAGKFCAGSAAGAAAG
jgi:hypothetical protein